MTAAAEDESHHLVSRDCWANCQLHWSYYYSYYCRCNYYHCCCCCCRCCCYCCCLQQDLHRSFALGDGDDGVTGTVGGDVVDGGGEAGGDDS